MAASELTQRCWEIAEELGKPVTESMKAFEAICDEMMHVNIERAKVLDIAAHVKSWKETKNPHYIDLAMLMMSEAGCQPTETLATEGNVARLLRFNGSPAGTAASIKNESAEMQALHLMANLIYQGMTLWASAEKAASYYAIKYPSYKQKKASTLERFYTRKIRATGIERDFFHAWNKNMDGKASEYATYWQAFSDAIPPCPDDLKGNARD